MSRPRCRVMTTAMTQWPWLTFKRISRTSCPIPVRNIVILTGIFEHISLFYREFIFLGENILSRWKNPNLTKKQWQNPGLNHQKKMFLIYRRKSFVWLSLWYLWHIVKRIYQQKSNNGVSSLMKFIYIGWLDIETWL